MSKNESNYIVINGTRLNLRVTEAGTSGGGKQIFKVEGKEGVLDFFGKLYAAGEVKPVASELEAARQENERLKKEAKRSGPKVFDTGKRQVHATESDGGTNDLQAMVMAAVQAALKGMKPA